MAYMIKQVDDDFFKSKLEDEKKNSTTRLPKIFNKKPSNYSNVKLPKFKPWILQQFSKHLPDDDIAIDYIYELLQNYDGVDTDDGCPDIFGIYHQVTDFLGEEDSVKFCKQLWKLIIEASNDKTGIPKELQEKQSPKIISPEESRPRKKTNYNRTTSTSSTNSGSNSGDGSSTRRLEKVHSLHPRREYEHRYGAGRDYEHHYLSRSARDRDESEYRLNRSKDLYRRR